MWLKPDLPGPMNWSGGRDRGDDMVRVEFSLTLFHPDSCREHDIGFAFCDLGVSLDAF